MHLPPAALEVKVSVGAGPECSANAAVSPLRAPHPVAPQDGQGVALPSWKKRKEKPLAPPLFRLSGGIYFPGHSPESHNWGPFPDGAIQPWKCKSLS